LRIVAAAGIAAASIAAASIPAVLEEASLKSLLGLLIVMRQLNPTFFG